MQSCVDVGCQCSRCLNLRDSFVFQCVMRNMSVDLFEKIHARLLVPFLMDISSLSPTLLPPQWILAPPSQRSGDSMRTEFACLCSIVCCWRVAVREGRIDAGRLIYSLSSRGDNLLTWLTTRRRWLFGVVSPSDVRVVRLRMQVREIRGCDTVFCKLYREALAIFHCVRAPLDVGEMCRFAMDSGSVDRLRALAEEFKGRFKSRAVVRYMVAFETALENRLCVEYERAVAVAMALHPRLGARSSLACVGRDLLPQCVPRWVEEPLVGWRDVVDHESEMGLL